MSTARRFTFKSLSIDVYSGRTDVKYRFYGCDKENTIFDVSTGSSDVQSVIDAKHAKYGYLVWYNTTVFKVTKLSDVYSIVFDECKLRSFQGRSTIFTNSEWYNSKLSESAKNLLDMAQMRSFELVGGYICFIPITVHVILETLYGRGYLPWYVRNRLEEIYEKNGELTVKQVIKIICEHGALLDMPCNIVAV